MNDLFSLRSILMCLFALCLAFAHGSPTVQAQPAGEPHRSGHGGAESSHQHHGGGATHDTWEGSAAGIAYSETNHHLAGLMVLLMGLAEASHAMRLPSMTWARLLLPSAMLAVGVFLTIWSDHEAWPVGRLGFVETVWGQDQEIIQHKIYGLLALAVGSVELFRRLGRMRHTAWVAPLPLMAIVGGLMLFGHSHGAHPSAYKIAVHHAVMGTMAVTAGSSKLISSWIHRGSASVPSKWEWLWAGLIVLIAMQLLMYSER
jgi:hypothetical protein